MASAVSIAMNQSVSIRAHTGQYKLADIDGDGLKDRVIATSSDNWIDDDKTDVHVQFNVGDNIFTGPKKIVEYEGVMHNRVRWFQMAYQSSADQLKIEDTNGDNKLDISLGLMTSDGYRIHTWINNLTK